MRSKLEQRSGFGVQLAVIGVGAPEDQLRALVVTGSSRSHRIVNIWAQRVRLPDDLIDVTAGREQCIAGSFGMRMRSAGRIAVKCDELLMAILGNAEHQERVGRAGGLDEAGGRYGHRHPADQRHYYQGSHGAISPHSVSRLLCRAQTKERSRIRVQSYVTCHNHELSQRRATAAVWCATRSTDGSATVGNRGFP